MKRARLFPGVRDRGKLRFSAAWEGGARSIKLVYPKHESLGL
jgi:hypothetical protein